MNSHRFEGPDVGPHLLVFGAIHGNELAGVEGIEKCVADLDSGSLVLKAGALTLVPVCNQRAFEQKLRFTEENLNRIFAKHAHPESYEQHLANELTALVDDCDYLLDLHSQSTRSTPFVFEDFEDGKSDALARATGASLIVKGWPQMFADHPELNAGDTTSYANAQGKTAVVLECGQYDDPLGPTYAYDAIRRSLAHLGMADAAGAPEKKPDAEIIRARKIFKVFDEGGTLTEDWQHLQTVAKDQLMATSTSGAEYRAPWDGVVILPKNRALPGWEWFYLGTREATAQP